ncbi:hypothetical protein JCM24511_07198 [Saitozyma sp. JCM 24511]|nr:hypothetical protein JCM24511_07198 [Saitozyma sp. JCM 24511]
MNDSQHSSPPPSKPIQVNSNAITRVSGRPGYTFATRELLRAPETLPMLMPVEQTQEGSEGHTSEYSSWGSSPARGSSGSSPPIFPSSFDEPSASSALQDVVLAEEPSRQDDEQTEAGAVTEDTVDGRSGVPSVMISSVGEKEEEHQEVEDEGGHLSVEQ